MSTQVDIPGYVAGTWVIDTVHSDVSFQVRHLGVSKVRGTFDEFEGTVVTAEDPLASTVNAVIQAGSVSTRNKIRDEHLHQDDFLNVERFPTLTFTSTGVRMEDDEFLLDGDLTIRDVTRPVTLNLELNGFGESYDGTAVVGFSATTEISREDFGVTGGPAAALVGDKIKIFLEIEAAKQA